MTATVMEAGLDPVTATIPYLSAHYFGDILVMNHGSMTATIDFNGPTIAPTSAPSNAPTHAPTNAPTNAPTHAPTNAPTTSGPTNAPTSAPTNSPTNFWGEQTTLCGSSTDPNSGITSSQAAMEATGWVFDTGLLCSNFLDSYCGWADGSAVGSISLALTGSGRATIAFGSAFHSSPTVLYLDDIEISSASANTNHHEATFSFTDGQVLRLSEDYGIILFHSISFECRCAVTGTMAMGTDELPATAYPHASIGGMLVFVSYAGHHFQMAAVMLADAQNSATPPSTGIKYITANESSITLNAAVVSKMWDGTLTGHTTTNTITTGVQTLVLVRHLFVAPQVYPFYHCDSPCCLCAAIYLTDCHYTPAYDLAVFQHQNDCMS